ncbi:MAG: DEAD/DEAH box helicase family protein [Bacteroidales bacterium]|nr:DEAD/DEAH box helicase family protein [Bacteroidales bacterium]
MKTLEYQQKAVRQLVEHTLDMLDLSGTRHTLVFHAPTGSGKTVMTTMALEQIALQTRGNEHEPVMIWIAPNALHEQSYFKMRNYFSETRELRPVMYDELDHTEGLLHPGDVLFVNWESINKEKNIMVRDSEQGHSLFEITRRTREAGHPIIVVIDEEHDFWSATADKSKQVLDKIDPKIELRVSATPRTQGEQKVSIPRELVIKEEMIKEGIVLNPNVSKDISDERNLTQHLLELALRKRAAIADAYQRLDVNINPLLLIQLPNDKADLNADDVQIVDTVKRYLETTDWNMTTANGRLAVWLSKEKQNLEGIEQPESMVQALLFKQAIAKGWDCPRAAVLLIFRKMNSMTFTMQTVGRILRMPEQHFYPDPLLNKGYVYTDLSADKIEIVADGVGYISRFVAKRRKDVTPIVLDSNTSTRLSMSRMRLGGDFKRTLRQTFVDNWGLTQTHLEFDDDPFPTGPDNPCAVNRHSAELKAHVTFNVDKVQVWIPEDVDLNIEGETVLKDGQRYGFIRRGGELRRLFNIFCERMIPPFEKVSAATLSRCLLELMEELFECFETEARKIILSTKQDNNKKYAVIVRKALAAYERQMEERRKKAAERAIVPTQWELPPDRIYDEETNCVVPDVENHALEPFIRQRRASTPEQRFEAFLEEHKDHIAWWYKNGDSGRDHYAIEYIRSDKTRSLFYVDFIIQMKSGRILLFDTKSANSDTQAPAKQKALIDYVRAHQNMGGGVIVEDKPTGNWLYSDTYIANTTDLSGWIAFFPDKE